MLQTLCFPAGEIVPSDDRRLSEDHPLDVEISNKQFLLQAQNSASYSGIDEKAVDESKIHSPLHLEVDLYSAAHILQARVNDATSEKVGYLYFFSFVECTSVHISFIIFLCHIFYLVSRNRQKFLSMFCGVFSMQCTTQFLV